MKKALFNYAAEYRTLSLAGMCKNAGKTTVLNQLIGELNAEGIILGITSIGRDGESRDLVTGTQKPEIYVQEGTLLATAAGLLKNCDATCEILMTTGMHTPLGEIILIRTISDGFIDLAGPSMNRQLMEISELFFQYQVDKVLIDGAISRKSLCSRRVAEAVVLCTGASYHPNMDVVVEDTKFICQMLQLRKPSNRKVLLGIQNWRQKRAEMDKFLFLTMAGDCKKPDVSGSLSDHMRESKLGDMPYIWVEGAFTDTEVKPLLLSNTSLKDKAFLVEDSSKILLSREVCGKLYKKGASLWVVEEIELLAVTINPFSAYGNHFDKNEFQEKMQAAVDLPVMNVMEDA